MGGRTPGAPPLDPPMLKHNVPTIFLSSYDHQKASIASSHNLKALPNHQKDIFFVFTADKVSAQVDLIQPSGCQGVLIPEEFFPSGLGIAMPKGSPYKPFFDHS